MINLDNPQEIRQMMEESVSGLQPRPDMRKAVGAAIKKRRQQQRTALAAVLVVLFIGVGALVGNTMNARRQSVYMIEAGSGGTAVSGVSVRTTEDPVLTREEPNEEAVIILDQRLYQMVGYANVPKAEAVGTVTVNTENPYDAKTSEGMISNAVPAGESVYAIEGISKETAILADLDGQTAVFQRMAGSGYGLNGDSFETTLSIRDQVSTLQVDGIGTLHGDAAQQAADCLLDTAKLVDMEALSGEQKVRVTLENGIGLQLGLSGDQVIGCGAWDCSEFLDLFRQLVNE